MGIQGLLPFLDSSTRDAHISEFENTYVAIDAYCWLHKGIFSCSYELAMKKPTTKYVTYCLRYIEMLRHFKVKPILVFDGRNLSSKEETEKKRREERVRKYKRGLELMRAGKTNEGRQLLGESVDVRHDLVVQLIKECHEMKIDCIVAPFEADAQLSYFSIQKIVSCVITEDSDLLAYGCERVLFKMDKSGRGRLVEKSMLYKSLGIEADEFKESSFRHMCILCGCDYLPSLPSIGPVNALKFVKLIEDKNIIEMLPKLPIYLNKLKITVTPEYIQGFKVAENTFKHQLVYNPFKRKQVPLTPTNNDDDVVGKKLPDNDAFQLAIGNIDPITMKIMHYYDPDENDYGFDILWRRDLLSKDEFTLSDLRSSLVLNGNSKRQSEVNLVKNDIKKYCRPQAVASNCQLDYKKSVNKAPKTSFVFAPKSSLDISIEEEEPNLLLSRYFNMKKINDGMIQQNDSNNKARHKEEAYEDYLQRLYEENTSDSEIEKKNDNFLLCKAEKNNSLLGNKKCVVNKNINEGSLPQNRINYTNIFNQHLQSKKDEFDQHSLLDAMYVPDDGKISLESVDENNRITIKNDAYEKGDSLQSSIIKTERNTINSDEKIEPSNYVFEKENMETNLSQRSPSPVFKVNGKIIVNDDCDLKDITDATGTPTSIYFSGSFARDLNSFERTQHSIKKPTSVKTNRNSSTKPKSLSKNSTRRTLFQFGFKKENKEEIVNVT